MKIKKIIYTERMCGACIALKKDLDRQGVRYEERSAGRLEFPEDEIDREAFIEQIVMKGGDPKSITLPIEFNFNLKEKEKEKGKERERGKGGRK
jgi:glutaredoxin